MKPFSNYKETQSYKQTEQLPIGGYILTVKDARIQKGKDDYPDTLIISFDIADGPFKDFYMRNWKAQDGEDKKWKGTYRLRVPNDDNTEADSWRKRAFKTAMENFEDSNEGFTWAWDETALKGLQIGGVFNKREYDFNGRTGFYTQCKRLVTVESIENQTFKQPETDYLKGSAAAADTGDDEFMTVSADIAENLPFA